MIARCAHSSTSLARRLGRLCSRLGEERGQALVEFAVVLPVLMLVIVGILYFGRYMNYNEQESQLAAEAARWAAVNYDAPSGTLQSYVQSQATGELANGSGDVTTPLKVYLYYPSGSSNTVGDPVRACVVATVKLLPLLGTVTSVTMAQTATLRIEQGGSGTTMNWTASTSGMPSACPTS